MFLEQLASLNMDRIDLDDAVELLTFGTALQKTYADNQLVTPEFVNDAVSKLKHEIATKRRENLEMALKQARARKENLKTAEQKRQETDDEIARLEQQLAQTNG